MHWSLASFGAGWNVTPGFAGNPAKQSDTPHIRLRRRPALPLPECRLRKPRKARTGIDRERLSAIVPPDCEAHAAAVQHLAAHDHGSLGMRARLVEAKLHEIARGSSGEARRRRSPGGGGADLSASYQKIVFVSVPRQVDARIRLRVPRNSECHSSTARSEPNEQVGGLGQQAMCAHGAVSLEWDG